MTSPIPALTSEPCSEFHGLTRRGLLRGTATVATAAATWSLLNEGAYQEISYAAAPAPHTLVVLSLRGGADGLSLVVPHGDPAYYTNRPGIAVPKANLLAGDAMYGLHPSFAPLLPLWTAGKMAAIQATGMSSPNRSHFSAMEVVEDADPGSAERRGWLNRMIGATGSGMAEELVSLGTSMDITSVYGPTPCLSTPSLGEIKLPGGTDAAWQVRQSAALTTMWNGVTTPLGTGVRRAQQSVNAMQPAVNSSTTPANGATYTTSPLSVALAQTARVIRANVGAEAITIDQGNWDMHTGVGTLAWGDMIRNVTDLAKSLAAFFQDLGTLANNVTLVTISEFGRRVKENANYGLDHGYGNAMFVMGAGVRGGRYYGRWPGLADAQLVSGDLAVTTDYRAVLAEIIRNRRGVDTTKVFPGLTYTPLGFMA